MKNAAHSFVNAVESVARRELRRILTHPTLRLIVLVAPFIYGGLFVAVYSHHTVTEVPIAIIQNDGASPARTLVQMLAASPKLSITHHVQSTEELKNLMLRGDIEAAVVIPNDFSTRLKQGRDATVIGYVNAGSMVTANTAAKGINEVVQTFSAGVEIKSLMKKGARLEDAREQFMPAKLDMRPLFNPDFNYSNFMIPGLLAAVLQQVILLAIALTWTGEREDNTMGELWAISRNPWAIMIGKALPYVVINTVVAEVFLRGFCSWSQIPIEGAWYLTIGFMFLFILTVVTWGMWMGGLCRNSLQATQLLMFLALPSFILSGFTWPRFMMPAWIEWASLALPLTWFVGSFRNIFLAGVSWSIVMPHILALGGFALANVFLAVFVIKRTSH